MKPSHTISRRADTMWKAVTFSGVLAATIGLTGGSAAVCQDGPPAPVASPPAASAGGVSAEQIAKANDPLADMNALNLLDSWISAIRGVPNAYINTMNLRPVTVRV